MTTGLRIEKLTRAHAVEDFRCGQPDLDRFLIRHAMQAQQANSSRSYVALSDASVVGYHTLVVGQIEPAHAPLRVAKGMPRHPIPLLILARLAVHEDWRGRGLGAGLLRDALTRGLRAADLAGVRALAVHAKNDEAVAFYRHFNFEASTTDARHLFLLVKDIKMAAASA